MFISLHLKPSYLSNTGTCCDLKLLFFLDSVFPSGLEPAPCNSDPLWLSGTYDEVMKQ